MTVSEFLAGSFVTDASGNQHYCIAVEHHKTEKSKPQLLGNCVKLIPIIVTKLIKILTETVKTFITNYKPENKDLPDPQSLTPIHHTGKTSKHPFAGESSSLVAPVMRLWKEYRSNWKDPLTI